LRVHPTIILIAMFVMLLIMGMFMDQVSIMMLTIPFLSLWRSP
jgi:TRAP-type C4-dicarboxylate transport system permease large subunit